MPDYAPRMLTHEFAWVWRLLPEGGGQPAHLCTPISSHRQTTACGIRITDRWALMRPADPATITYCDECTRRNGGVVR